MNLSSARPTDSLSLGLSLMLIAFFCFATMDTTAKWLVAVAALPALQVAFLRYVVHFAWVVMLYVPREGHAIAMSNRPYAQLFRGSLLLTSTALNFTAMRHLPLTITIAIFFAIPMVVCLLSIPFLGEKVGIRRFLAVVTGFLGVTIIVEPWGESFDYHIFYALGALMTAAGYFVMTRKIAGVDRNSVTQFYSAGLATVMLAPFALSVWQWPDGSLDWGLILILGSLGMLGHTIFTRAHHYAEASVLAPTVYSQIIYITFYSWVIFNSPPDANTIIGTTIIVLSGVYIWLRERTVQVEGTVIPYRGGR